MISTWGKVACAAATAVCLASASFAQAVSAPNGKVSVESGSAGAPGRSSVFAMTQGAVTVPVGQLFGVQLDGMTSTSYGSWSGGGALHAFWRDPRIGLIGPVVAVAGSSMGRFSSYGGEAELYADRFTVGLQGGYQGIVSSMPGIAADSGYVQARLWVYPVEDFALSMEGGQAGARTAGGGGVEFLPELMGRRNVSFFAKASVADNGSYIATGGLRIFFGPDNSKSLIRRHREDDPAHYFQNQAPSALGSIWIPVR